MSESAVLDFDILGLDSEEAAPSEKTAPTQSLPSKDDSHTTVEAHNALIDDITKSLLPQLDEEHEETAAETKPKAGEKPVQTETKPTQPPEPIRHSAKLLEWASSWGISPAEAEGMSRDALQGQVALRELRYRDAVERRNQPKQQPEDELPKLELDLDEDTDPKIKSAIQKLAQHSQKLDELHRKRTEQLEEQHDKLFAEHQQAAEREARDAEAKIAVLFDEKVSGWGEEFKEILGTPQETWRRPGTEQHTELQRLRAYVIERKAGHEATHGVAVGLPDIARFIDEARYALWPDRATVAARREVQNGLKKQRGGVGLRPSRARDNGPVPQGDKFAMESIVDYMPSLDPWNKAK
jgi:hypothetical protein